MLLSAETIFDRYLDEICTEMGIPESAGYFDEHFITPAREKDAEAGEEMYRAFWMCMSDFQREAYIFGFKAAVQLLAGCVAELAGRCDKSE